MADISKVTVGGNTYNIKDSQARNDIQSLQNSVTGGMHYIGTCITDVITDAGNQVAYIKTGTNTALAYYTGTQPTAATVSLGGVTYTLTYVALKAGDVAISGKKEYVFSNADSKWHEFGSTGSLKALAFKDNASGSYKPEGNVASTFNGTEQTVTHTVVNNGSVSASGSFTPAGTVAQGTITQDTFVKSYPGAVSKLVQTTIRDTPTAVKKELVKKGVLTSAAVVTKKLVKTSIAGVSGSVIASKASATSVQGMTASVANETLTLTATPVSFTDITVPKAAAAVAVATGDISETGTGSLVGVGIDTEVADVVQGLTDDVTDVVVDITPGTEITVATGEIASSGTGDGLLVGLGVPTTAKAVTKISNPTFTGTAGTVNVTGSNSGITIQDHSITPTGTVASTFNGTQTTITVD